MKQLLMSLVFVLAVASGVTWAGDGFLIINPTVREAPPGMMTTAGYAELLNESPANVVISGASSDAFKRVEIHLSKVVGGVAQMLPQHELVVPANGKVELKPGSFHLMLMGANIPLKAGDEIDVTFETSSGEITSTFVVKKF